MTMDLDTVPLSRGDIKIEILVDGGYVAKNQKQFWDMVKTITSDETDDGTVKAYKISRFKHVRTKTDVRIFTINRSTEPVWEEVSSGANMELA